MNLCDAIEKLIRRPWQTSDEPLLVEDTIRLAERLRWIADRKGEDAIEIEDGGASVVECRAESTFCTLNSALDTIPNSTNLGMACTHQLQRHIGDLDDRLLVCVHQRIDDDVGLRPITDFLDRYLVNRLGRRRQHLAAAFEPAGDARHRLERGPRIRDDPAHPQKENAQRVQAALVHQRPRHHLIVDEMAGQEPVIRMNVGLRANEPQAETPAARIEMDDAIDELHLPARNRQRILHVKLGERGAEATGQIAGPQGVNLRCAVRFDGHRHEVFPIVGTNAGPPPTVEFGLHDPLARVQLSSREETGAAIAHRQERFTVHGPLEAEAEQIRAPLAEKMIDGNFVTNHRAGSGQGAMERHHCIQQAIDCQAARLEIDAQIAGEEQVRLPGFDSDAGRNPLRVEIPGPRMNVVLRHHHARRHRARLSRNRHDAIHQHQRLIGQPDTSRERIDHGELGAEHVGDRAHRELQAHRAVQPQPTLRRRRARRRTRVAASGSVSSKAI